MRWWCVLSVLAALVAASCYNEPEGEPDGPPPAGSGRVVFVEANNVDGPRRAIREAVQVRDPVSGGSTIAVLLRNLGDAPSGNFSPAVLNIGAGAGNALTLQTDRGVLTLYMQTDGTLSTEQVTDPLSPLTIPAIEGGALRFATEVEPLILSGVYLYELDVTTEAGPSTIEITVTSE